MPPSKPKNIIVLHLESVSQSRLWEYRSEFNMIWQLLGNSLSFSKFYTTATSSTMSYMDFVCGDSSAYDPNLSFGGGPVARSSVRFMKSIQKIANYDSTLWIYAPPFATQRTNVEYKSLMMTEIKEVNLQRFHNDINARMSRCKEDGRPFFMYFWNHLPHLASTAPEKEAPADFAGRFRTAFSMLDRSISRLLQDLANNGLLENTTIVGFGDHGDELWTHGINKGYCHALEGYASVCWTPMFIFDSDLEPGVSEKLACTIDLYGTLMHLLDPDFPVEKSGGYFYGIDLFREERKLAFTQNLCALQGEYADLEKGLGKSYAVTDGEFRLVVCSDGAKPQEGGMELYLDELDPANRYNLLNLFTLDGNSDINEESFSVTRMPEMMPGLAQPEVVKSIVTAYRSLRSELIAFIQAKETKALGYLSLEDREKASLFPQAAFTKIRRRNLNR